jgi:chemotaxis response regulator CheB
MEEKRETGNEKIKVLVVDDSAFMRVVISDMLNASPRHFLLT